MEYKGNLVKMKVIDERPVRYFLKLGENELCMNDLIGRDIKITFEGIIHCVACGRKIKKAFGEGFCYPCFINSPLSSECIIRPELCLAHEGKGRDPVWEEENHNKPHYIYLAQTSHIKVGITRATQIPTRWLDQGAWKAIRIALTPNRYLAGMIEVELKNHIVDKTHWQKMLKNETDESIDLLTAKEEALSYLSSAFSAFALKDEKEIYTFEYPVQKYPGQVKSINLDKSPLVSGELTGIRGQYLIFSNNLVINIRRYSGYEIRLESDH